MADDYGRFEAEPQIVLSLAFPAMSGIKLADTQRWFKELEACEHVRTYVCKGKRYGIFTNWERYQGKPRAEKSKYPDPPANICEHLPANVLVSESESESESVSVSEIEIEAVRTNVRRRPAPKVGLPDEFRPDEDHRALAKQLGVDCFREFAKFTDSAKAHSRVYADWDAAFRNWLRSPLNARPGGKP